MISHQGTLRSTYGSASLSWRQKRKAHGSCVSWPSDSKQLNIVDQMSTCARNIILKGYWRTYLFTYLTYSMLFRCFGSVIKDVSTVRTVSNQVPYCRVTLPNPFIVIFCLFSKYSLTSRLSYTVTSTLFFRDSDSSCVTSLLFLRDQRPATLFTWLPCYSNSYLPSCLLCPRHDSSVAMVVVTLVLSWLAS